MEFVLTGRNTNEVRQEWRKLENGRVSPRTYNNNIKLGRAFFSWAVEKSYARINPFEKLKHKRAQGKSRTIIPKEDRDRITAYFQEHNPAYIIVMQLVYKSFLRYAKSPLAACSKGLAINELPPNHRDCAVVAKMGT